MAQKADLEAAYAFQDELRKAMDGVPRRSGPATIDEIEKRTLALRALKATIENRGGAVSEDWRRHSIRIFGVRATSTAGLHQACRNWLNQLTVKMMGQNMKGPYK